MTSKAAILALLTIWGVGTAVPHQAWADEMTTSEASADKDDDAGPNLTDKVWVKTGTDLPGVIKIFLSDGTLVQDSCWETHRLSPWQMAGAQSVSWNEDGAEIKADIVSLTASELVLSLKLKGGAIEEHYVPAAASATCPDVPKG
jgi:hypothetical protein